MSFKKLHGNRGLIYIPDRNKKPGNTLARIVFPATGAVMTVAWIASRNVR